MVQIVLTSSAMRSVLLAIVGPVLVCGACGGHGSDTPDAGGDVPDAVTPSLTLRFDRVAGSQAFDAIATLANSTEPVVLTVDHGTLATPDVTGPDTHARVTPSGTGNYLITATAGSLTTTRTALVLGQVDDAWNQPEPVRGLANTLGWEDGPSISPDGSILTLQYLPVSITCFIDGDLDAPACRVVGPMTGPERPGMPGGNRVNADGTYVNACPTAGIPELTTPVPPDSLYALQRQSDGSFADPHAISYAGIDGCVSAFGLQLVDRVAANGAYHVVYSFDDPTRQGVGSRLFEATIDPLHDVTLGSFANVAGTVTLTNTIGATSIGDGGDTAGVQGNPGYFAQPDGTALVFSDDEQGRKDLFVNARSAAGTFAGQKLIPPPVSANGPQESQPFFDGHTLLFRRELTILATDWNGGPMDQVASWSTPRTILAPGDGETDAGTVNVVGEPSVTLAAGAPKELYFVYARRVADGTLNLDVAMVLAR